MITSNLSFVNLVTYLVSTLILGNFFKYSMASSIFLESTDPIENCKTSFSVKNLSGFSSNNISFNILLYSWLKYLAYFVSKKAFYIDGLGEQSICYLFEKGIVKSVRYFWDRT